MLRMQDILSAMEMAKQGNGGNPVDSLVGGFQSGQKIGEILKNSGLFGSSTPDATQTAGSIVSNVGNVAGMSAVPGAVPSVIPPIPPVV